MLANFLTTFATAAAPGGWAILPSRRSTQIRERVGDDRVICGLSGGVDSSVVAALLYQAIGPQLSCILVDNGLLRKDEEKRSSRSSRSHFKTDLHVVKAEEQFLDGAGRRHRAAGEAPPHRPCVHRVLQPKKPPRSKGRKFLAQGTLYPDVIESGAAADGPAATIKLHHNVGGLPEDLGFELIEPLRDLFKDEVRRLGLQLGLPEDIVWRHPFPGPGLAVRCLGEVTKRAARHAARGRRDRRRRDQGRRACTAQTVAGLRRAAAGAKRRRDGRRPHVRKRASPCGASTPTTS